MSSERPLLHIPVDDITENTAALRAVDLESEDFISLTDSIRSRGVLTPIQVRENPNVPGKYILTDGLQRLTASRLAGCETIPAQVINMTDFEVLQSQLIANVHRIETRPVEYAQQIQRILAQDLTLTLNSLSSMLNRSSKWLSDILGLVKLSAKAKVLVNDGAIVPSKAYILAKLPPEEQDAWLDRAMSEDAVSFIGNANERLKQIKEAKRQGRAVKPEEWTPVARIRKLTELKTEVESPKIANLLCKDLSTPLEGFIMGLKFSLHLDPESIRQAKEKDEARRKKSEEEKKAREAERAKKKDEERQSKLTELEKIGT